MMVAKSKKTQYIIIFIVYLVVASYSFGFAYLVSKCDKPWCKKVNRMNNKCYYSNESLKFLTKWRGKGYCITDIDDKERLESSRCIFTLYGIGHIVMYIIIGYYARDCFWEAMIAGILVETFEGVALNCHDALDVLYNLIGFVVGYSLYNCINKN